MNDLPFLSIKLNEMKFYILSIFILISIQLSAQNIEDYNEKLSVEELQEDFKLLQAEFEEKHPGLYLYTNKEKLDSVFQSIENSLNVEMDRLEFYRRIKKLNSTIKDGHTVIIFPIEYMAALKSKLKRFPFHIYTDESRYYILENYSDDSSITIGSELLEINSVPIEQLVNTMSEGISRDGNNKTYATRTIDYYFSELYAINFGCPESYVIKLKNPADSIITKIVSGLFYNKMLENGLRKRIEEVEKTPYLSHQIVDKNMIVSLKSFSPSDIKGETNMKYKKEFKRIFSSIHDQGVQRLVIDIRDNLGGWPEVSDEFLSYLVPYEFNHSKTDKAKITIIRNEEIYLKEGNLKHFKKQNFEKVEEGYYTLKGHQFIQKPKNPRFAGEVLVLINGRCGSQSGAFSGLIDDYVNATFIGEETGANKKTRCAGNIINLILPHSKLKVNIPLRLLEINTKAKNDGHGIIPDIPLIPTIQQKIKGEDIVLKKSLEIDLSN